MSERSELRRIQRNLDFIIAASDKQDVGLVLEWWTVTVKNQKELFFYLWLIQQHRINRRTGTSYFDNVFVNLA